MTSCATGRSRGPLHGLTVSIKDLIDVEGITDDGRLARAAAAHRARRCDGRRAASRGRGGDHRQVQPARVRARHDERGIGVRARAQSSRHDTIARRIERRVGRRCCRRSGLGFHRIRYRRVDPHSGCGVRGRRTQTDVWRSADARRGSVSPCRSIMSGPLARNVADACDVCLARSREHRKSTTAHPPPWPTCGSADSSGYFDELLDADVRDQFEASRAGLRDAGASITDVRIPGGTKIAATYVNVVAARSVRLSCEDTRDFIRAEYSPGVAERLEVGRQVPAEAYVEAQRMRGGLRERGRRGAEELRCAGAADSADSSAENWRRLRRDRWASAQTCGRSCSPDSALQSDRPSGDFAAVRLHRRRAAVRTSAGWKEDRKRIELLAMALSCEAHVTPRAL